MPYTNTIVILEASEAALPHTTTHPLRPLTRASASFPFPIHGRPIRWAAHRATRPPAVTDPCSPNAAPHSAYASFCLPTMACPARLADPVGGAHLLGGSVAAGIGHGSIGDRTPRGLVGRGRLGVDEGGVVHVGLGVKRQDTVVSLLATHHPANPVLGGVHHVLQLWEAIIEIFSLPVDNSHQDNNPDNHTHHREYSPAAPRFLAAGTIVATISRLGKSITGHWSSIGRWCEWGGVR